MSAVRAFERFLEGTWDLIKDCYESAPGLFLFAVWALTVFCVSSMAR